MHRSEPGPLVPRLPLWGQGQRETDGRMTGTDRRPASERSRPVPDGSWKPPPRGRPAPRSGPTTFPQHQSGRLPPQTCKGPPASRICFMSRRTERVSPLFAADLGGSGGGRAKPAIFGTRVLHGKEWVWLVLGAGCTMGKATPRLRWARVSRPHSAGAAPAPSLSPEARAPAGAAAPDAGPLQRAHCLLCLHVPRWQGVLRRSTRARGVVTTRPRAKRRAPRRGRPSSWRLDRLVRV